MTFRARLGRIHCVKAQKKGGAQIMSMTITLPAELETKVQKAALQKGQVPAEYILEAIENAVQPKNGTLPSLDDLLDWEYMQDCQAEADPTVTLEAVRKALAKIPGSMSDDFSAERDER
jgi:hypothetical protein